MGVTAYLPGVRPGAVLMNGFALGVSLAILPVALAALVLWTPVAVYTNYNGAADAVADSRLAALPGLGDGTLAPATAFGYTAVAAWAVWRVGAPLNGLLLDVHADWRIAEKRTYEDSDGNERTRWETVAAGGDAAPFRLEDDTGAVEINDVEDADFRVRSETETTGGWGEAVDFAQAVLGDGDLDGGEPGWASRFLRGDVEGWNPSASLRGNATRYTQSVLRVDEDGYVFGAAVPLGDGNADLEVVRDDGTGLFVVSDRDEAGVAESYSSGTALGVTRGLAYSAAALYVLAHDLWVTLGLL